MSSLKPGSFEYLEAVIRRDAEGTLFGRDFEWVCQWYLEHAPLYRGKFRKVWRWARADRWGRDCGVDLIAETHDCKLWAIQAKAIAADRSITKAEVDSFLAESNRRTSTAFDRAASVAMNWAAMHAARSTSKPSECRSSARRPSQR